jgi:GMP synthase-like glutamine amidotransferase
MTKSLIINCSLDARGKIEELRKAFCKFSGCTIVSFRDIDASYEVGKDIDAVVLSGSKARIVSPSYRALFKKTVDLINLLDLPVFGICYGYQLLCWSLGCNVASLSEPVIDRFEDVHVVEVDDLLTGFPENGTVSLVESHYDYVIRDSLDHAGFLLLTDSASCEVEGVKHKHKPFYGAQFHPELTEIQGRTALEGHKIIENFYQNVVKK